MCAQMNIVLFEMFSDIGHSLPLIFSPVCRASSGGSDRVQPSCSENREHCGMLSARVLYILDCATIGRGEMHPGIALLLLLGVS